MQEKDGILLQSFRMNSFLWKDLKEALHLIFFEEKARTYYLVSRQSVSLRQTSSSKPQIPESTWHSQVRICEKRSMNSECCSIQRTSRNGELRVNQKTWEICLSETHVSRNREVQAKDLSSQTMLISDAKATIKKEWKEILKKILKNKRNGKSTLLHWRTSIVSKSTSTSRRMFARAISCKDRSTSTSRDIFARIISS